MTDPIVRPFAPEDRTALRRLAVSTADRGNPSPGLAGDPALLADLLTDYYAEREPEALFVAERAGDIAGYLTGCLDTRRYLRDMSGRVVPRAFGRAALRGFFVRPTAWALIARLIRPGTPGNYRTPGLLNRWPSHLHLNLDPSARGRGLGKALIERFFQHARQKGSSGVHLAARADNPESLRFFSSAGFREEGRRRLPGFLPGEPPVHEVALFVRDLP